ncbi:hypothetical protein D3C74_339170 [compost metagenome]
MALCEAATTGVHYAEEEEWPGNANLRHWVVNIDDGIGCFVRHEDAKFDAEAREGWPYAIHRAISAEAEVAKLRAELKAENLRAAEWEGAALGYEEENAKLREVIEDFVDHVREVTALIRPNETEFSCDYRRVWSLSRLAEIYSEVPHDAAEDDE